MACRFFFHVVQYDCIFHDISKPVATSYIYLFFFVLRPIIFLQIHILLCENFLRCWWETRIVKTTLRVEFNINNEKKRVCIINVDKKEKIHKSAGTVQHLNAIFLWIFIVNLNRVFSMYAMPSVRFNIFAFILKTKNEIIVRNVYNIVLCI